MYSSILPNFTAMRFLLICWMLCNGLVSGQNLMEEKRFGYNPGNLKMYYYTPANLKTGAVPLLVVMHGCNQNAATIARESGFNQLADEYGFIVLYPQQRRINNGNMCFNWFLVNDQLPSGGEAESILNMVRHMQQHFPIDSSRIFAFGVSAGAAMTVIQGACFPEMYKAIAPLAGAPYKAATGILAGMKVFMKVPDKTDQEWGQLVTALHDGNKTYPRVTIFHGTQDHVVSIQSSWAIFSQWSYLHGVHKDVPGQHGHPEYSFIKECYRADDDGNRLVDLYEIAGIGHALPVTPDKTTGKGGQSGLFTKNIGFYLPEFLVKLWGL